VGVRSACATYGKAGFALGRTQQTVCGGCQPSDGNQQKNFHRVKENRFFALSATTERFNGLCQFKFSGWAFFFLIGGFIDRI
jgi:hypothetical protein